jgi:hypothetical protein
MRRYTLLDVTPDALNGRPIPALNPAVGIGRTFVAAGLGPSAAKT